MAHSHIIAIDESECAEKAFDFASENLPKKDKFIVFHGRPQWIAQSPPQEENTKYEELMRKYQNKCKQSERNCEFVTRWIRSVSEISYWVNDTVKQGNASSIVLGSRGISTLERLVLGSTSHAVLNNATVPVIVAKCERKPDPFDEEILPIIA